MAAYSTPPLSSLQIHRELTQVIGYKLQLDGINLVSPGNRYIGVTYQSQMQEFLSQQVVGKTAWNTVLAASDRLEPRAVFQFLPTVDGSFFVAFKTSVGIFGLRETYGVMDLKYSMTRFRANEEFGWVFKSPIMYTKQSNKLFTLNPFRDCILSGADTRSWTAYGASVISKKSWSEFIADGQDGAVDAVLPVPYSGRYGVDISSFSYQQEINKNSAMAIELQEKRMREQEMMAIRDAQIQALYAQDKAAQIFTTRWYEPDPIKQWKASWDSEATDWQMPPRLTPTPEPAPVKAKFGRMIILRKDGE